MPRRVHHLSAREPCDRGQDGHGDYGRGRQPLGQRRSYTGCQTGNHGAGEPAPRGGLCILVGNTPLTLACLSRAAILQ